MNVMAFNSIKLCRKNKIDKIAVDFPQEAVTFIVSATCTPNLVDGKVLNFLPGNVKYLFTKLTSVNILCQTLL